MGCYYSPIDPQLQSSITSLTSLQFWWGDHIDCEASAQQQGHPNSEPTCAPGSEALSHQSSADSDDEDLEDDADLAPMVHQDQLQKLTKDVRSQQTTQTREVKYMASLEEQNLLISAFF